MTAWLTAHYDVIKDFAAPVVTLIAAVIAGLITLTFSRAQTRVSRSQRDIALDRLKFDLFEKRYAIYDAAKSLLTSFGQKIRTVEKTVSYPFSA